MANSKDNISKYATSFIGFDEASGNVYDSIGGYVGTLYNAPTRVTGWNGEGSAMSFNGSNQYIQMNSPVTGDSTMSFRFKIKPYSIPSNGNIYSIIDSRGWNSANGWIFLLTSSGNLNIAYWENTQVYTDIEFPIPINEYSDVLVTFDGSNAQLYIDDMLNPVGNMILSNYLKGSSINLHIGGSDLKGTKSSFFYGELDQIEIYDRVISPISDKHLVLHGGQYKYHNGTSWQTTTATEENFIQYGHDDLSHIIEAQWAELQGEKSIAVWSDFEDKEYVSAVLEKEPFTAKELIGDNDEVEVLYYTDDESVESANLIIEANHSPLDELEGNFDVLTYYEDADDLEIIVTSPPKPTLVIPKKDINIKEVEKFEKMAIVGKTTGTGVAKIVVSFDEGRHYFTWNGSEFVLIQLSLDAVLKNGIDHNELANIPILAFNNLRNGSNRIRFAYALAADELTDAAEIDEWNMTVEMTGTWDAAVHGTDFKYQYPNTETLVVTIMSSGDFKINY